MESPEEIENALGRLVPVAISERGQRALDGTIDGLSSAALPVVVAAPQPRSGWWTAAVALPTAAAAALAVALIMKGAPQKPTEQARVMPDDKAAKVMDAGVSEPVQTIMPDDEPDDMTTFTLNPAKGRAYVTLPNGILTCFATADGENEFVVTNSSNQEIFRGKLDDASFPKVWKRHAKGIQAALKNSMDRQ